MSKITFYAPRGGTGRSLALANVAVALAMKHKRVGILDLDVEAGGLAEIFNVEFKKPSVDLIDSVESKEPSVDLIEILKTGNIDKQLPEGVIKLDRLFKKGMGSDLFFLPTVIDSTNTERVQLLHGWPNEMVREITLKIIDDFWRDFSLDYLLIDSRTGKSQWASIALSEANLVVLMTRLNRQGLLACKDLLPGFHQQNIDFLAVASCVPSPTKHAQKLKKATKVMGYKFDHILPYAEEQAFDETLLVLKSPSCELSKAYYELADTIIAR